MNNKFIDFVFNHPKNYKSKREIIKLYNNFLVEEIPKTLIEFCKYCNLV